MSCSNSVTAGWSYEFGATRIKVVGSDGFTTNSSAPDPWLCTVNAEVTIEETYSQFYGSGEAFDCLPNCSYKELNRVSFVPSDPDGRTAVEWTWHTPGSNTIWYVKTILADPANNNHPNSLNTFVETITID
jgi:hypothetical protein